MGSCIKVIAEGFALKFKIMTKVRKRYLLGHKWGEITYIGELPDKVYDNGVRSRMGEFRCYCGNEFSTNLGSVVRGLTRSCGCIPTKWNGLSKLRIFRHWAHMMTRCYNPNHSDYYRYGGRGIIVYEEWRNSPQLYIDYISTLEDFGRDGYNSIDRINNDGNYEPGNIQWATQSMQVNNRSIPKSKTGYIGVYEKGGSQNCVRYRATVYNKGRRVILSGTTKTPQESAVKRDWYIVINGLNQRLQVLNSPK